MEKILTQEDQRYLRMMCKYLTTLGLKVGTIELYLDEGPLSDINYEWVTHFSNSYTGEIPDGLKLILQKIVNYIDENGLTDELSSIDNINRDTLEINIYVDRQEIEAEQTVTYVVPEEDQQTVHDSDEDKEIFNSWLGFGLKAPSNGKLTVRYQGSGDDGALDNHFDETDERVPADIEDTILNYISSAYSGWENDLGAEGMVILDFNEKTTTIYHTYFTDTSDSEILWRENFAKRDI